jgi:ABC-2 type transport system permease protein
LILPILFADELQGFYKSKVMVFLWVGLPALAILFRFVQTSISGSAISFTVISALLVSSLAGTLSAVMLSVSIINEKNRHVFELFLIRPIKRRNIILAKFISVYSCVAIASLLSVVTGLAADLVMGTTFSTAVINNTAQSLEISLTMIAVACAAGTLIGVVSPSVLVGAILVIYGANQISIIPLIPTLLNLQDASAFTVGLAGLIAATLLIAAVSLFDRQQF